MSGETFNDASMLEIFRAEVETHVESLTAGLLALERDPADTTHVDEMMRGAHSIKGAARIVGIDPAVRIAHVMEDGFVAAQNGKLTLRPEHVDVLLRGVDLLNRISSASKDTAIDWQHYEIEATPLVAEISAVLNGAPTPAVSKKSDAAAAKTLTPSVTPPVAPPRHEVTIPFPAMLDSVAAEVARLAFVSALDVKAVRIRLDLRQTRDLDAVGLAFLAAIPAAVKQAGCEVQLVSETSELRDILEVTGVDRLYSAGGP